jgi:tetratricopeptide (TPR) repeat protein
MSVPMVRRRCPLAVLAMALAATSFAAVLASPPDGADGELLRQVRSLLAGGNSEEAERLAAIAVAERPDSPELLSLLGVARYSNRRYLTAEEPLRRAVELGQQDLQTLFYLGSTLWENGRLAQAETICRTALDRLGPRLPLIHLLGRLYLWQGRFADAVVWLRQAVAMRPGSADLWIDLAGAMDGAEMSVEALECWQRAVDLAPDHYQARYGLAGALRRVGESEPALRELVVYRRLLEEDQERTRLEGLQRAQVEAARDLLRRGEVAAAIERLRALPTTAENLTALAECYTKAGDRDAAIESLERAVALAPEREDIRARLTGARLEEMPRP